MCQPSQGGAPPGSCHGPWRCGAIGADGCASGVRNSCAHLNYDLRFIHRTSVCRLYYVCRIYLVVPDAPIESSAALLAARRIRSKHGRLAVDPAQRSHRTG